MTREEELLKIKAFCMLAKSEQEVLGNAAKSARLLKLEAEKKYYRGQSQQRAINDKERLRRSVNRALQSGAVRG